MKKLIQLVDIIMKFRTFITLFFSLIFFTNSISLLHAFDEETEHAKLREFLVKVVTLINTNNIDEIDQYIDINNFVIITGDGQIFTTPKDVKQYWKKLTASGSHIKNVKINPKPASYTNFLSENVGVAVGTSIDEYDFGNNNVKQMKMFWTVVVTKSESGWKLSKIHYSTNMFDNLVLDFHKRSFVGKMFW